jgi:hypothetical protein
MDVLIRAARESDHALIFDSYLKSWRINKAAGTVPNHLFYQVQRTLLEDLISRGALLRVAYPEGHEDLILGWACAEEKEGKTVLHYLYVKDPYLGLGLPELLLNSLPGNKPGFITHKLPLKETKEWRHTPEMARRKSL